MLEKVHPGFDVSQTIPATTWNLDEPPGEGDVILDADRSNSHILTPDIHSWDYHFPTLVDSGVRPQRVSLSASRNFSGFALGPSMAQRERTVVEDLAKSMIDGMLDRPEWSGTYCTFHTQTQYLVLCPWCPCVCSLDCDRLSMYTHSWCGCRFVDTWSPESHQC